MRYAVKACSRADVELLVRRHCMHSWPGVVPAVYGLQAGRGAYVGVAVFALPPRETFKRYNVGLAWELARFFVDAEHKRKELWFLTQVILLVKQARPDVELLVTYVDPVLGESAAPYLALNWQADGRMDEERKTPRFRYLAEDPVKWQSPLAAVTAPLDSRGAVAGYKAYGRRGHIPEGFTIKREARASKFRYVFRMTVQAKCQKQSPVK